MAHKIEYHGSTANHTVSGGDIDQSVNFRDAWHPKAFLPGVGYWISIACTAVHASAGADGSGIKNPRGWIGSFQ